MLRLQDVDTGQKSLGWMVKWLKDIWFFGNSNEIFSQLREKWGEKFRTTISAKLQSVELPMEPEISWKTWNNPFALMC